MKEGQKGLITDFDNTIVKTTEFVIRHTQVTCQTLGIECPSQDKLSEVLKQNLPFEKIFENLFAERASEVLTKYRETAMEKPFEPIEGGLEAIKTLNQGEVQIVIVSNRINKLPERLEQAGYDQHSFLAIVQPTEPKPSKKAYLEAIKVLTEKGVPKENIFITGDSLDDYQACSNDLLENFSALLTGPNTEEEFIESGVEKNNILTSISDLPNFILNNGRD